MGLSIKIAAGSVLLGTLVGGYFYIESLRAQLQVAAEIRGRLESVIDEQKVTLERQLKDIQIMHSINAEVSKKFADSQEELGSLKKKFSNERFRKLAKGKPSLLERKVNQGTVNALRCNELVTGAKLTKEEMQGTIKNSICADLISELREKVNAK
jgi:hypothetical protein